jgi:hypothetical protein
LFDGELSPIKVGLYPESDSFFVLQKEIEEWKRIFNKIGKLIHKEEIPFTTYEDENGKVNIYVSIRILKEYNFVSLHYPGDINNYFLQLYPNSKQAFCIHSH